MASSPLSPGDHFFEADGVRFHYFIEGTGPLVICQGGGWGAPAGLMANGFGPHLKNDFTLLYNEARGNGQSSRPEDPATMCARQMVEDLEHLRKHIGLEAFPVLTGGSHSAAIAVRYAEVYPQRVEKLVIGSTQVMDGPPNTHFKDCMEKRKGNPAFADSLAMTARVFGGEIPKTDEEFAKGLDVMLPYYFADPKCADVMRKLMPSSELPSLYGLQTNMNDMKPENKLPQVADAGKVTAKTLIIRGAEDALCSMEASQALHDGIKGSKLAIIEDCGHCTWIEKPEEYFSLFRSFVKE